MLSTSAQQLKEMGASLGLEGQDLVSFIREQQKLEREDRDEERDRQREEKEREAAEKEKERTYEEQRKKKKKQRKKEEKAFIQVADVSRASMDEGGSQSFGRSYGKAPKMLYFDEEHDFMDSYLSRFERFATCQRWNRAEWALYLSALLKGRALDVYSMLPADQANNYDQLKAALLKRYQLSVDGFKRRFRTVKPESGETPTQFLTQFLTIFSDGLT